MKFLVVLVFAMLPGTLFSIRVSEATYEGSPHYIIKTRSATYWFDRHGGGLSRMIDRDGNDWIAFKREPWNKTPESAASSYRGIPNAVYQGEDGGCGHPGWDKCESNFEAPNVIRTVSKSGKWEWTWTFHEDFAEWRVLKADTARKYWFLFEGPTGGTYMPENSYWYNSDSQKIKRDTPDHMKGERVTGNWRWVLFGRDEINKALLISHMTPDDVDDSFSYMGNDGQGIRSADGMTVFGLGRTADSKPLLKGNHIFEISIVDTGSLTRVVRRLASAR